FGYDKLSVPASALRNGLNTFTVSSTDEDHGPEILWPGPAMLVTYNLPPRTPTVLPAFHGFDGPPGVQLTDLSGNGNDGLLLAGAVRTPAGKNGSGVQFDGVAGAVD